MTLFLERILRNEKYAQNLTARDKLHSHLDLLLHPRRPPFVRTLPFVESFSLLSAEESVEEAATRNSLDLAFGSEEILSITSERQNYPNPVSQSSLALGPQAPIDLPQERALPTPTELRPQNTECANSSLSTEVTGLSVLPTELLPQATPDILTGPPLSISEKVPASTIYVAPMLVDESDHEEVPTIDMGSDSDA